MLAVGDPTEAYMQAVVPVGWMLCTCGERRECPKDCERFIGAKQKSDEYLQQMFDDLVRA